jgi:pimeloyl-ACP methyl ester carboxylesterase
VTAAANWRPIIPAIISDRRVIAPDQLGFSGTATGEQRTYGRTAWTGHALALLDTLGAATVDIIGNSMGGAIALSMAAARPGAVRRMVLMGSMGVAMALPPGLDTVWGYVPGLDQMRQVIGRSRKSARSSPTSWSRCGTGQVSARRSGIHGGRCFRRRGSAGWTTWRCPEPSSRRSGARS